MGKCWNKGQSLVEVVVAIGAMSVLLVALLSLMSLSLKNSRMAKNRAKAVALAQEGVELMRAFRDYSWSGFTDRANGNNYNLPGSWVVEDDLSGLCSYDREINELYYRCVSLNVVEAGAVIGVSVEVGWPEGENTLIVNQSTQLANWQR